MRMLNDNEITYVSGADDGKGAGTTGGCMYPSTGGFGVGYMSTGLASVSSGYLTSISIGAGVADIAQGRSGLTSIYSGDISFSPSANGPRDFSAGTGARGIATGTVVPAPGVAELGSIATGSFAVGSLNITMGVGI